MSEYMDNGEKYEISSILLHRGDAYSGHYHAFIRDTLKEGNWDLEN